MTDQAKNHPAAEFGEGNYKAARDYDERTRRFVKDHKAEIDELADDAAEAIDGSEGTELEQAEAEGRSHAKK